MPDKNKKLLDELKDAIPIPLTQGKTALVDEPDYVLVKDIKWQYHANGYANSGGRLSMHRFIMGVHDKSWKDGEIDHINGDKLDNRRSNLRLVTHAQNRRNCLPRKDSSTGHKGVFPARGKYEAKITIGTFDTPEEAAEAYNKVADSLFGEFCYHNRIE